ncbi:MAG TPA: alcohol dehydrogenase [Candidatus Cybelea sp.]|nr:alcohol dehydrogenase [Candidatus Cybelea sp.]
MLSQQIVDWGKPLEARTYPDPVPEGTEVVLKVRACGVCHSDLHIWEGHFDLGQGRKLTIAERGVKLPFTLGHEVVGEVIALGPEASGVKVGDRRVVYPWIGCGECPACASGDELMCLAPRTVGTRRHGGYSDRVLVPHARYLLDYTGIDEALAATCACSGLTAYSALKKLPKLKPSDTLLIVGAGGVGMAGIGLAATVTDARLVVADVDPAKRAAARQAGAAEVVDNSAPDALQALQKMSGGGVAAAVDFVGAPASAGFAIEALRRGGTLVVVGLYGGAMPMPVAYFPLRMMRILGSYVGTLGEMRELLEIARTGRHVPVPIVERRLNDANAVLEALKAGKVLGRTVLRP